MRSKSKKSSDGKSDYLKKEQARTHYAWCGKIGHWLVDCKDKAAGKPQIDRKDQDNNRKKDKDSDKDSEKEVAVTAIFAEWFREAKKDKYELWADIPEEEDHPVT